ncbi:chorismate mutase [Bacillaceae bacterium]
MTVRGIRGATTVKENSAAAILEATQELLGEMIERNRLVPEQVASVLFTVTRDLDAEFPAKAMRSFPGWEWVPLICANEIPVPGSLDKCIRIMMLVNTEKRQDEINHVFLKEARGLRPDLLAAERKKEARAQKSAIDICLRL